MKCKVCGAESGRYPLCRACNVKKEKGEVIKCNKCGNWHYADSPCYETSDVHNDGSYVYEAKETLISKNEQIYYGVIKCSVPLGYLVFPQINLATFIERTDDAVFHNELFRNVDFLITDAEYKPKIVIEINDRTHLDSERRKRDEKVKNICEEAGIPILKLWTTYEVNPKYIQNKISETLDKLPIPRVHHFNQKSSQQKTPVKQSTQNSKNGCYIATCVYGSYDCPQVWVLRRYRDNVLSSTWYGRTFIKLYYTISPKLVKLFGNQNWFKKNCGRFLNNIIENLQFNGFENTPYNDK